VYIGNKIYLCPACKSRNIKFLEAISTLEVAKSLLNLSSTASDLFIEYLEKKEAPDTIYIDKCRICGLEFSNPMFYTEGDWYSKIENYYGIRPWDYQQCLKNLSPNSQILEIGCGEGHFLDLVIRNGHSGIGLDFNHVAVQVARKKELEVYCYNLKDIKKHFQNIVFDVITFFHVIEHIDDLEAFFQEISSIMNKDSSLHFSCPNPNRWIPNLDQANTGLREGWDYPPHHQTRWNKVAANNILSRFGWKLKKYDEEPFNWYGSSVNLVSKDLVAFGSNLSMLSPIYRKIKIAEKMIQVFVPSLVHTGANMYCHAIRQ
jgi:2-polyprenyl-3-methyl-5-hydroxy-6-metoxy-1,4-benzoquinol methylase